MKRCTFQSLSAQHCTYMYIIQSCTCTYILQEVDERFLLVFSDDFVILAVGRSLSGYEMKVHLDICVPIDMHQPKCA